VQYELDANYCAASTLQVGYHQQYAGIVRFDLTSIPADMLVTNATLQVYAQAWDGTNIGVGAFYITRTVDLCQATWDESRTGVNWGSAGCNNTSSDRRATPEDSIVTRGNHQWYGFDLTTVVQGWVSGTLANNGVLLRASQYADLGPFYFASAESSEASLRPRLVVTYRLPAPLQVTTDPYDEADPSLLRAQDGKLWVVWTRLGDLWFKTSLDDGRTWSADVELTSGSGPTLTQLADGRLWLVWTSSRSGQAAIWQRFSEDGGATWSPDAWVADTGSFTAAMQSSDGRLWIVAGYAFWSITSADGGVTWSPQTSLAGSGIQPDIFQADDGKIWLVFSSYAYSYHGDGLGYVTSSDGGTTWSSPQRLSVNDYWGYYHPRLAQAADGTLVLMWHALGDPLHSLCDTEYLGYRISGDGGATWSGEANWMPYAGHDAAPSMALLGNGGLGVVWESGRAGNNDLWFGILGATENPHPPPYVCCVEQLPLGRDPYDDEQVHIGTSPLSQILDMYLVWSLNGTPQPDLEFLQENVNYHPCMDWYVHLGPFPTGTQVTYQVRAVDSDGDSVLVPSIPRTFTVLARPTATRTPTATPTVTPTATQTLTPTPTATVPPAVLRFHPGSTEVYTCTGAFTVALRVQDVADLGGFGITFAFDSAIVQVQDMALGNLITSGARPFTMEQQIDNILGQASLDATSSGALPGPSGSGALAVITFSPVHTGTTTLALQQVQLMDTGGTTIPVASEDGSVTVFAALYGDLDCDCDVDIVDIMLVASRWATKLGDPQYDPRYDLDGDGDIDIVDIMRVATHWGDACTGLELAHGNR